MFRRILGIAALLHLVLLSAQAADTWVSFHSATPADPKIDLIESDDSHVLYRITVPGMWVRQVDGGTYYILECAPSFKDSAIGVPSLPIIPANLAIPTGASLSVSVAGGRKLVLSGYNAAPVPRVETRIENGMVYFDEYYEPNTAVYSTDAYYPDATFQVRADEGFFVTQQIGGVDLWPIRFNPILAMLEVTDTLTVTVTFSGGTGGAVKDLGLFNAATRGTLINSTEPIVPIHLPGPGSVRWVTAADSAIDCDYLIVIPDQNWTGLARNSGFDAQVQRFADMRASLSGFDVCIVRAATITAVTPPGAIPRGPDYIGGRRAWEGIRSFIRAVFERGHAYHTGTGQLGFVLLIGDARDEDGYADSTEIGHDDWLIPSPRPLNASDSYWGSDHWYACLTHVSGTFDDLEDVALGRFPVGNTWELTNMVDKVHTYSVSPGDRQWNRNIFNMAGYNAYPWHQRPWFRNAADREDAWGYNITYAYCYPWSGNEEPYADTYYEMQVAGQSYRLEDRAFINSRLRDGAWIFAYFGHGVLNQEFAYYAYNPLSLFIGDNPLVANPDRLHFVIDVSCGNAWIDANHEDQISYDRFRFDGCAERATVKSHNGAIGFIGASRSAEARWAPNMYDLMTESLLDYQNGLAGIAFLRYKTAAGPYDYGKRIYHYMGDPALNLHSDPVSSDITSDATWSGTKVIGSNTLVANGATLTLLPGTEIILLNGAILDIQGRLIAEGTSDSRIRIHGTIGQKTGHLKFTNSNGTAPWNCIRNCDIYNLYDGVLCSNSTIRVELSDFTSCERSISGTSGTVTLVGVNRVENVNMGGELAFEPAAITRVAATGAICCSGRINAQGTAQNPIIFERSGGAEWAGLRLRGGGTNNRLEHVTVRGARHGVIVSGGTQALLDHVTAEDCESGVVYTWSTTGSLTNSIIRNNRMRGVFLTHSSASVSNNQITENGLYGLRLWGCTYSNISNNLIQQNGVANDTNWAYWPGIELLEGAARLSCNDVSDNEGPGLVVLPQGFAYMGNGGGYNDFRDNMRALGDGLDFDLGQIFQNSGNIDIRCGMNTIEDVGDANTLIYMSPYMPPDARDFGYNYWGTTDTNSIRSRLTGYPVLDPVLGGDAECPDPQVPVECTNEEEYAAFYAGWEMEIAAQYGEAADQYYDYLAQYPGGKYEALALDRILFCKDALEWGWADIRAYFQQMAADSAKDSAFVALCLANAAWCLIEMEDWEDGYAELEALLDPKLDEYAFLTISLKKLLAELKEDASGEMMSLPGDPRGARGSMDETAEAYDQRLTRVDQALSDLLRGLKRSGGAPGAQARGLPAQYALYQNYPNPFNPNTEIRFDLPEANRVELRVFNSLGQLVTTLLDDVRPAGAYTVMWNGTSASGAPVASGLYIYQIKAGSFVDAKKMLLLK